MSSSDYQLLDFGGGRKLERFGAVTLDRPAPAAEGFTQARRALWEDADARYERQAEQGVWRQVRPVGSPWIARFGSIVLELKLTEFGHLGLFPEQIANWQWIGEQVRRAGRPLEVLNLFAYTGASTLAAAAAGASVTHVDSAANVLAWARRNAERSGLNGAPIRWIAEDALKFVRRELKRARAYDALILDPPGYGHGPKGETWKLEDDLAELLSLCQELTRGRLALLLLTCHSGELASASGLLKYLRDAWLELPRAGTLEARAMDLETADGRKLNCGAMVRWIQKNKSE